MITIILGTRPEIIKMSPIIRECETQGIDFSILHTGQHYSFEMDRTFFEDLGLPAPAWKLDVGSGSHADQTGRIMAGIEKVLGRQPTGAVLVQGDTNTVLGGALAASKLHIPVGHVEAGLRSFDRRMPEEINRIVADHISDYLFAPTRTAKQNLLNEGLHAERIHLTGNTVVDAVRENREIAAEKSSILEHFGLEPERYFLATAHRPENVDSMERMKEILRALSEVQREFRMPVIFPAHPRTAKMMELFGYSPNGTRIVSPLGYLEFLQLMANARMVLTDSGGVQEETCILGVPCVTLRDNTERPETVDAGANILAGADAERVMEAVRIMSQSTKKWDNPFGDGRSGRTIVRILTAQET